MSEGSASSHCQGTRMSSNWNPSTASGTSFLVCAFLLLDLMVYGVFAAQCFRDGRSQLGCGRYAVFPDFILAIREPFEGKWKIQEHG